MPVVESATKQECGCVGAHPPSAVPTGWMGSWWAEEAAVQSGAELGAAGPGLDPLVRDQEAFASGFCKRGIRGERLKWGRVLNRPAKEGSVKGRRLSQTPCSSAGEMM